MTCSQQGACIVNGITPECKCFTGFLGKNCDQLSQELQTVKMISDIASIIAYIAIAVFIGLIVSMDLMRFIQFLTSGPEPKKKKKVKKPVDPKKTVEKPTFNDYVPNPE